MIEWKKWWRYWGENVRAKHAEHDREQEPYMVVVQASRVSGNIPLFDSEHKHQGFISLRIKSAYRDRSLGNDWIHDDKELIEVNMSEAQWAAMISTLNFGSGVPATLQHIFHEGVAQPKAADNRTDVYHAEFMARLEHAVAKIDALSQTNMTKAQKNDLAMIRQEIVSNMPFMAKQFREHMETRKEKAKSDIEAHMQHAVQRVGLTALAQSGKLVALLERGGERAVNG